MRENESLAREMELTLMQLSVDNSNLEGDEDDDLVFEDLNDVMSYEDAGMLTRDKGIVVRLGRGTVHLTIQAYS